MSKKIDRTGEVRTMNCGLEAKIIAYRRNLDMDVFFPGVGSLKTGVQYENFLKGCIVPSPVVKYISYGVIEYFAPSNGCRFTADYDDEEIVKKYTWRLDTKGYVYTRAPDSPKRISFHRLVMGNPEGLKVDHLDGNPLNNKKENLRICTQQQNVMNRIANKNSTSKYKGVSWLSKPGRWAAQIGINGKNILLGTFNCEKTAAIAYNEAAKKYHGEFARLNTI